MTRAALHCASALALAAALASPASADDALVRGLLGLGTAVIVNGMQQNPQPQPYAPQNAPPQYRPAPQPSASRARTLELRAEIQRRLNALGFDAGTPDGVFGPRTRRAIADFQRSIGRPASGMISDSDIKVLYARSDGVVPPTTGFAAFGDGQAKTGGFPALGSAGGGAAAPLGFPALGKATAGKESAGASAFPTLGAPPQDAAGTEPSAFPPLGGAPKPVATAYPKFGAAPADAPAAFPAIATGDPAASDAGPAMPALAQPGAPSPTDMPALARPDAPVEQAMPPLAKPGSGDAPADVAADTGTTLAEAAKRTSYGSADKLPTVLGIGFGQSAATAGEKLKAAGFAGCGPEGGPLVCKRTTASLTDTVSVWISEADGVWAIVRTIAFAEPAPAGLVLAPFKTAYPELMATQEYRIAPGEYCRTGLISNADLEQIVRSLPASGGASGQPVDQSIAAFAAQCPLVLSLAFAGTDRLTAADLAFVDLTGITQRAAADKARAEAAAKAKRKQLTDDLKL